MVVGHHYMQMYFNYQYDNPVSQFFVTRGSFGIDLFFVLSGLVMFFTSQKPGTTGTGFFVKRVMRIIPAYWFYTTVFLVWIAIFPEVFAYTDYNFTTLIASYLLIPSQNPSGIGLLPVLTPGWTLIYEFTFYTTLAICIFATKKYAVQLCFALIFLAPLFFPDGYTFSPILGSWTIWQFLAGFVIGWYVRSSLYSRINAAVPVWLQCAALFIGALLLLSVMSNGLVQRTAAAAMIVQASVLIDLKAAYKSALAKFMIRLGDYSYSTYLCHVLVIGAYLHFTGSGWGQPWYWHAAVILSICVSVHFVAKASYRFVEQGSGTNAVKRFLLAYSARLEPGRNLASLHHSKAESIE